MPKAMSMPKHRCKNIDAKPQMPNHRYQSKNKNILLDAKGYAYAKAQMPKHRCQSIDAKA
jgi:hypothetical protein